MVTNVLKSIRLARIEKKHSHEFIATRLNLTQSFYAKIEAGNPKLSLELFFQLINILELDYVGLFTQIKRRRQSVANVDVINNKIVKGLFN